jgi:MerR family redox-sensitive transcriptional activator SoxR
MLTIGDVARRVGVNTSTIRYYESVGLLPAPQRINGRRCYDEAIFQRLGLIQIMRQAGFSIGELQVLVDGGDLQEPASTVTPWQQLAEGKVTELEALIQRTEAIKTWLEQALACRKLNLDDCVTVQFDENGEQVSLTLSCVDASLP